ncbi:MAG TPA: 3'-5' exonuclease [Candidatus Baltobacteraceae bacterium]|nr:3'-5' exonuclease [Candidatus Baltobacteraceae bacterium]
MIGLELDATQRDAVAAPFDACVAIVGPAGSGKTTAMYERLARARAEHPDADPLAIASRGDLDAFAFEILESAQTPVRRIDDVEAEDLFAQACEPLFDLQWEELARAEIDPEVPGLRSPERFAESAFRLIRKLRDANIDAAAFCSRALAGATEFYAKPPNFADPSLLAATKSSYHDSLDVLPRDLQLQYRQEVDLAKIVAKLYAGYVELTRLQRTLTARDAVAEAAQRLREDRALADRLRVKHELALVDHAEELTQAQLDLLEAIFGDDLRGVTFFGDPSSAIDPQRVTHPEAALSRASVRVELVEQHRSPPAIDAACRRLLGKPSERVSSAAELSLHRARSVQEEAQFVADRVCAWLDAGTPAERIAILLRSVQNAEPYEQALLDRDVPAVVAGDLNVFADRRALDAIALLWNVYDPFAHQWMLRTLSNPALGLSDASLATLCSEPPDPQTPLFVFDDDPAPTVRASRWDVKRDLRLGWNVVRGDQDAALSARARTLVERFRRQRLEWVEAMHSRSFAEFARIVWRDGLAREGAPGSAGARAQNVVLQRLLTRLEAFLSAEPDATVAEVLLYAENRAQSSLETCIELGEDTAGCVRLLGIDLARGCEFDRVVVAGASPGSFPRWYAPDAFLFSPRLGMIPKENAADGRASRTAKFSYYTVRAKTRERYNEQERRAFVYALRRARKSAIVTASGTPTKGITAPEFLEELRRR